MKKLLALLSSLMIIFSIVTPSISIAKEETKTIPYTVVFSKATVPSNAGKIISALGGEIVYQVPEIGVVQVKAPVNFGVKALSEKAISAATPSIIEQLPEAEKIALDSEVNTDDALYFDTYQWDIKRLTNNGETFKEHSGSHDVVVGIIDSGIDLNHPDVQKNFLGGKNFVPAGGVYGVDNSERADENDIQDRNGHGTHVAGSIAGNGRMLGVAPNTGFKAYRVFGAQGGAYSTWIMNAIIAAANDGVNVINMSLGGIYSKGQYYYTDSVTGERTRIGHDVAEYIAYQRAVKYAESKGVLIVTSAGNDAVDASSKKNITDFANQEYGPLGYEFKGATVYAPAAFPNVITVAATGPNDNLAVYSNYGAGFIDVAAPGGDYSLQLKYISEGRVAEYMANMLYANEYAFSSVPRVTTQKDANGLVIGYTYVGPGYSWYVGTSMAAPKVTAIAALIYDANKGISPNKVKVMLKQKAEDIGQKGTDNQFGHGLATVYGVFQ